MASLQKPNGKEELLNDSWEELHFQAQQQEQAGQTTSPAHGMSKPVSYGQMEKLLLEAQKEWSRSSSRMGSSNASSRGSPKSPHSPNNEVSQNVIAAAGIGTIQEGKPATPPEVGTDWIWDWSSRPEAAPPSDMAGSRFKHPRKHKYSVRNTPVMRVGSILSLENLPYLLLSHACTFFIGAAAMFIFLKKYCKWSVVTAPSINY